MEQQGILTGYRAVVDIQRIGYPIQAFINLEMEPRQKAEFYPWAGGEENILECNCVTGQYSMLLRVAFCRTMDLDQFIGKLQRFGRTQTQIVFFPPDCAARAGHRTAGGSVKGEQRIAAVRLSIF